MTLYCNPRTKMRQRAQITAPCMEQELGQVRRGQTNSSADDSADDSRDESADDSSSMSTRTPPPKHVT